MIIIIICENSVLGFEMKHNLVHIAISLDALTLLIESGYIHAVDFRCLDANSKKTVWQLLLSTLQSAIKEQPEN